MWFEEVDQFEGLDAVRSILNRLWRGGDRFWIFYSYNLPKTMWSWVNVELLERKRREDTLVRGSSYLDVIDSHPEWLGAPFIEEAEYLRDVNETAWRWEYLGEIVGAGGVARRGDGLRLRHLHLPNLPSLLHARCGGLGVRMGKWMNALYLHHKNEHDWSGYWRGFPHLKAWRW